MRTAEPGFLWKTFELARKDLKIEARGREILVPMLFFTLVATLLLAFTLPGGPVSTTRVELPVGTVLLSDVIAGFLWVTVLFAGLLGFARSFEIERDEGAIETLVLAPIDRSGLFAAKALANLFFLALVQAALVPLFALLFNLRLGARWSLFLLVLVLADVGFVSIGTLFAWVAAQTRARELMLPVLSLPVLVPIFLAAVELSADLFAGTPLDSLAASGWFGILVGFDVIFAAGSPLAFDLLID